LVSRDIGLCLGDGSEEAHVRRSAFGFVGWLTVVFVVVLPVLFVQFPLGLFVVGVFVVLPV
jgi:hypothetical protein